MKPYYQVEKLIIDYRAREWCRLPYPGHPLGCPNYGMRDSCPPKAPRVEDYFDLSRPLWLIVTPFNLVGHMSAMKQKHPNWSDRQAKCVLYWQAGVNKELRLEASSLNSLFTPAKAIQLGIEALEAVIKYRQLYELLKKWLIEQRDYYWKIDKGKSNAFSSCGEYISIKGCELALQVGLLPSETSPLKPEE